MEHFELPHDHGEKSHTAALCRELGKTGHFAAVSDVFKQLSDSNRVRIFWLLSHQEACVVNIAAMLEMSSPAVSHHLRSLAESGLLESRREGKEVYYRAPDTELSRLLHQIVEQVMEIACPEKQVDFQAPQEEIVRNVHQYLIGHLSERVTIDELSRRFLMNPTTLKSMFKKVYGDTIAAHMRNHRLAQAALLLQTTGDEVAAIAQAVGYDSPSRFTTAFREVYGQTPVEYRRQRAKQ